MPLAIKSTHSPSISLTMTLIPDFDPQHQPNVATLCQRSCQCFQPKFICSWQIVLSRLAFQQSTAAHCSPVEDTCPNENSPIHTIVILCPWCDPSLAWPPHSSALVEAIRPLGTRLKGSQDTSAPLMAERSNRWATQTAPLRRQRRQHVAHSGNLASLSLCQSHTSFNNLQGSACEAFFSTKPN